MKSDELDKILDGALSSYSREEPRPGLHARVLDRIRSPQEGSRFGWLRWAVAIPAFACVLFLAVTFWSTRDSIPKSSHPARAIAQAGPVANAAPIVRARGKIKVHKRSARRMSLPKREKFPTPAPLTSEERALLAFVARLPKQAEEILINAKRRSAEPLQIEEIHIEPLESSGE